MNESSKPDKKVVPRDELLAALRKGVRNQAILGTVSLALVGAGLVWLSYQSAVTGIPRYIVRQLGGGLLVAAAGAMLIPLFVDRYREGLARRIQDFVEQDVSAGLENIREGMSEQAQNLSQAGTSLGALSIAGVTRVYSSRNEASSDVERALQEPHLADIRLMGISLNDFVRSDQPELHRAWKVITSYVRGETRLRGPEEKLSIRALVIDPLSFGAQLRSYGESREPDEHAGRLVEDVRSTADFLLDLRRKALDNVEKTGVSFDFRLYHLPPTLFLCHTNRSTYVQPYYFWSKRQTEVSLPVLKCDSGGLHRAMQEHFDLIWDHASTDGHEWVTGSAVGTDLVRLTGAVNVLTDPATASERMTCALQNAKDRVSILGVSLRSFFQPGPLYAALLDVLKRGVDVRVLLLDPTCEQAKYRSFREHSLSDHCSHMQASFDDYRATHDCHLESTLVHDTKESIGRARSMHDRGLGVKARMYCSAPSCFLLLVDESAFVEQYHYGKVVPEDFEYGTPSVLGKDMALMEFARSPRDPALYELDRFRSPYALLDDHFNFVFDRCGVELPSALDLRDGASLLSTTEAKST